MINSKWSVLMMVLFYLSATAQPTGYSILLEPVTDHHLPGLQSYAFGQFKGKWLLVGGRIDGLHQRRPFDGFDKNGNNLQIFVFDPSTARQWTASIAAFPAALREQLQSTNMQFYQRNQYLYLTGGYGYSASQDEHTTYASLVAIDIPATITAIINNQPVLPFFRQIQDPLLQVAGGKLGMIEESFYLVGGHKFIGRYNPMGPDRGPGFFQEYTNQVRIFNIVDDGEHLQVHHLKNFTDSLQLHRRDLNVVPQVYPNGQTGLTAFSGVFQYGIDLPYLNSVHITPNQYHADSVFEQTYNHYHCANIPFYNAMTNEMFTLFFGGIAQFYEEDGILVQDNNVPFVKTIAMIKRDSEGKTTEYKLPIEMPHYLGGAAEFLAHEEVPHYTNGVIRVEALKKDTTMLGHIFGGIKSFDKNVFWSNDDTASVAATALFRVLLIKNIEAQPLAPAQLKTNPMHLKVFPDVDNERIQISYQLDKMADVRLTLRNKNGRKVMQQFWPKQPAGKYDFQKNIRKMIKRTPYLLMLQAGDEIVQRKLVIEG